MQAIQAALSQAAPTRAASENSATLQTALNSGATQNSPTQAAANAQAPKSGRAAKVDGVWTCCGVAAELDPLPNWTAIATCRRCGSVTMVRNHPTETRDPFAAARPVDALNEYQLQRLNARWHDCGFGRRYRHGEWAQCNLSETVKEWHATRDMGLLITGTLGTGKTVTMGLMMTCLAARNEFSFTFWHTSSLLTLLHNWRGWGEDLDDDAQVRELRTCRYLFLDDVGVEYNSPLAMSRFHEMVEARYSRELLFVATSNLDENALCDREGWARIIDRIQENALGWAEIGGASKRRAA